MGDNVGILVRDALESALGKYVGIEVGPQEIIDGCDDCADVGINIGAIDEMRVGDTEGDIDVTALGTMLGAFDVGHSDGDMEGHSDGELEGAAVGRIEGTSVGILDGGMNGGVDGATDG